MFHWLFTFTVIVRACVDNDEWAQNYCEWLEQQPAFSDYDCKSDTCEGLVEDGSGIFCTDSLHVGNGIVSDYCPVTCHTNCQGGGNGDVVVVNGGGTQVTSTSTCYDSDGTVVPNCQCDPTCKTCGWGSYPGDADDCLTCLDGSSATMINGDSGVCPETTLSPNGGDSTVILVNGNGGSTVPTTTSAATRESSPVSWNICNFFEPSEITIRQGGMALAKIQYGDCERGLRVNTQDKLSVSGGISEEDFFWPATALCLYLNTLFVVPRQDDPNQLHVDLPADNDGCSGYDIYFINYCLGVQLLRADYTNAHGVQETVSPGLRFQDIARKDDATQLGTGTTKLVSNSPYWTVSYGVKFDSNDLGKSYYYGCFGSTTQNGFAFSSPEDSNSLTTGTYVDSADGYFLQVFAVFFLTFALL